MASPIEAAKNRTSCDLCKRMKIRCEKQGERCAHCIARDVECVVTVVPRKKRQKKTDYLSTLEDRLMKMEAVITASASSASASESPETGHAADQQNDAALSEKLSSLYIDEHGSSKYVGSSSGFSLFSPQGLEWITKKTGNTNFANMVLQLAKHGSHDHGDLSGPSIWRSIPDEERVPLPEPTVARTYIECFFNTFNRIFPLFSRDTFEKEYARVPVPSHVDDTAWYAALNIVIAIGSLISSTFPHQERVSQPSPTPSSELSCWQYFRNSSSLYVDLTFAEASLMAVQAMVGMATMMQAINDPNPSYNCAAAAVRLAYSMGLHRKMAFAGFSEEEMEQRSNIFWTIYIIEQGFSIRSGRPSMINDDDIGIDPPKRKFHEDLILDGIPIMGTFPKTVELACLSSRVYNGLYTAKSQTISRLDRLKLVGQFDKELEQWRESLPTEIRPGEPIVCHEKQVVPVMMLQFQYYFTLTTIHRVSVHHGYWINERVQEDNQWARDAQLNPRVFASGALCLSAARSVVRLYQQHNQRMIPSPDDNNLLRMADYYPLTATLTLFANILQHPQDENAPADIELMTSVIHIIGAPIIRRVTTEKELHALNVFKEMLRLAGEFVSKARQQDRHKRSHDRSDSIKEDRPPQGIDTSFGNYPGTFDEYTPANSGTTPSEYNSMPTPAIREAPLPFNYPQTSSLTSFASDAPSQNASIIDPGFATHASAATFTPLPPDPRQLQGLVPNTLDPNTNWWTDTAVAQNTYLPFENDDQDLLMGWEDPSFFPMNMTYQWDLDALWTGKGIGAGGVGTGPGPGMG